MAEVPMKTDNRSALHTLMRTLTDADLHDLVVMVQTEFLNRPAQQDGFAVEVVTEEEAALLGRYRRLPPTQRERLQTIACGASWSAG
jgi:glutamine synthetase